MLQQIRVLIVDDEALMRAGIRLMIDGVGAQGGSGGIAVVGEAANGADALAAAHELDPDVILLDIRMPGMSGIEVTRTLQAEGSRARIVMLTAFDTDEFILDSLGGGALSFVLKDAAPELLVAAVRDAAAGNARLSPAVLSRLVALAAQGATSGLTSESAPSAALGSALNPANAHASTPGITPEGAAGEAPSTAPSGVTDREWQVAQCVAQGLTNKEIAGSLYLSVSTVKTHLTNVSAKLHVTNRTQLAMRVRELF